jgi:hypothetical protein
VRLQPRDWHSYELNELQQPFSNLFFLTLNLILQVSGFFKIFFFYIALVLSLLVFIIYSNIKKIFKTAHFTLKKKNKKCTTFYQQSACNSLKLKIKNIM